MKTNINFNKYFKTFNIFSIILIIVSVILLITKGLNLGVDFKGGTLIELRATDKQITITQLRQSFLNMDLGDISVKEFGKKSDFLIKFEKKQTGNNNLIGGFVSEFGQVKDWVINIELISNSFSWF